MKSKHYGAIDGLRTLACLGILMMHIKANNSYQIDGYLYNTIIPSFTNFVFLFMTISSFGMCCGYYNKVINKEIDWNSFYLNRFKKILPFFSFLVLIDFVMNPSLNSLYESFANITLLFGLLPNAGNIEVIGVGWFLGLIFVFYLIFPFFTTLLQSKKKAWITFLISIIYNFVCTNYFNVSRSNILYSSMFFMAGGLVFLYKEELERINKPLVYLLVLLSIIVYYLIGGNSFGCLLVSVALLILAIVTRGGGVARQSSCPLYFKYKYGNILITYGYI